MVRVGCAFDGSENSTRALDLLLRVTPLPREIHLVTAIPQIEGFLAADAFREGNNYVRFAKIMEDRRESAHIQLSEKKKELEARGEVVFIHVETGDARQILLNHSNDLDLLFVGSRGLGKIRSLLLGSTSAYLATHSKIPITIVH